jgi:peptidylprolyl isomerase
MRTAQQGDLVQVHYVKHWQDGSTTSSSGRAPVEVTVGVDHRRLPGLGMALIGLAPGDSRTVTVPADQAFGPPDPGRVYRLARSRFATSKAPVIGQWVRLRDRRGRRRLVRIVQVNDRVVVVDNNHPRAGQALSLEVKLVAIHGSGKERAMS